MSRLIDADALMEYSYGREDTYGDIKQVVDVDDIDKAPTVCNDNYAMGYQDGVKKVLSERPQGEWINPSENPEFSNREFFSDCSICGYTQMDESNFCPNCGAEMLTRDAI